mmetsp:Transcript_60874/g.177941  ORF Transcript_60874/g.177941 Transcript_60874/m.177941 type:complete len:256 (+) Transcript_60874:717-1484(+)
MLHVLRVQRLERQLPARAVVLAKVRLERPNRVKPVQLERQAVGQPQTGELLVQHVVVEGVAVVRDHRQPTAAPCCALQEGNDLLLPARAEEGQGLVLDDLVVSVVLREAPRGGRPDVRPVKLRPAAQEQACAAVHIHGSELDDLRPTLPRYLLRSSTLVQPLLMVCPALGIVDGFQVVDDHAKVRMSVAIRRAALRLGFRGGRGLLPVGVCRDAAAGGRGRLCGAGLALIAPQASPVTPPAGPPWHGRAVVPRPA